MICALFFFQAEDGIRDLTVTGVQTCALPICRGRTSREESPASRRHPWIFDCRLAAARGRRRMVCGLPRRTAPRSDRAAAALGAVAHLSTGGEIGRASCRERVEISEVAGSLQK